MKKRLTREQRIMRGAEAIWAIFLAGVAWNQYDMMHGVLTYIAIILYYVNEKLWDLICKD